VQDVVLRVSFLSSSGKFFLWISEGVRLSAPLRLKKHRRSGPGREVITGSRTYVCR